MRTIAITVFAFAVSLSVGVLQAACSFDPCDCPPDPKEPIEQSLPLTGAVRYDDGGNTAVHPLNHTEGTVTSGAESLLIQYNTPEGDYVVTYDLQEGHDY